MTGERGSSRSWVWDEHGEVIKGAYVGIDEAPERFAGTPIVVLERNGGERVGVWLFSTVLRSRFAEEVGRRTSGDLDPGERIRIERLEERVSGSGRRYRNFRVEFEHAAPKRSAREILGEPVAEPADDEIPF